MPDTQLFIVEGASATAKFIGRDDLQGYYAIRGKPQIRTYEDEISSDSTVGLQLWLSDYSHNSVGTWYYTSQLPRRHVRYAHFVNACLKSPFLAVECLRNDMKKVYSSPDEIEAALDGLVNHRYIRNLSLRRMRVAHKRMVMRYRITRHRLFWLRNCVWGSSRVTYDT